MARRLPRRLLQFPPLLPPQQALLLVGPPTLYFDLAKLYFLAASYTSWLRGAGE